jgi:DNA-binding SARP family transcriptional activator
MSVLARYSPFGAYPMKEATDRFLPGQGMHRKLGSTRALDACAYMEVFDTLPQAVVVVDDAGQVIDHNPAAGKLFGALLDRPAMRCCDLLGCGRSGVGRLLAHGCITAAVAEHDGALDGLDFVIQGRVVEVVAAPLRDGAGVVLHLSDTARGAARSVSTPPLRITTLGPVRLECGGRSLGGEWLDHRPGQLLKYLVSARGQRVAVDELVEALWPDAGPAGLTSLRQAVHGLRDRLEPGRSKHAPSRFVIARANAYELDTANIVVDADEFEREAAAALTTLKRFGGDAAKAQLAGAARMYLGDFLADERYADWALGERDRLRELAVRVLRELADAHLAAGELPPASSALQRLADLEPLDLDAQRDLISLLLRRRRHGDAARRYGVLRRQFKRAFGYEPDFSLADLVPVTMLAP